MLLKITEKCSLGCTHCLNRATENGKHMTFETLKQSLDFLESNDLMNYLIVTGGEPTEHPEFEKFIKYIVMRAKNYMKNLSKSHNYGFCFITITTNGFWCLENPEIAKELISLSNINVNVSFQVSTDSRFYPKPLLNTTKRLWREPGFILCDNCVESINPIGRARDNNIPYNRISSSCFNIRAITRQFYDLNKDLNKNLNKDKNKEIKFNEVVKKLQSASKFCTPGINISGNIILGESDLCPSIGSVNLSNDKIINNILNFKCHGCDILNDKLHDFYKRLINHQ